MKNLHYSFSVILFRNTASLKMYKMSPQCSAVQPVQKPSKIHDNNRRIMCSLNDKYCNKVDFDRICFTGVST